MGLIKGMRTGVYAGDDQVTWEWKKLLIIKGFLQKTF